MHFAENFPKLVTLMLLLTLSAPLEARKRKQSQDVLSNDEANSGPPHENEATWIAGNSSLSGENVIKIGSFNLKQFGMKKANNEEVLKIIAKIIMRYDMIALQEVTDVKENAIKKLIAAINQESLNPYNFIVSPRVGRTKQKEQYALFFRPDIFQIKRHNVFNDSSGDPFSREPQIAEIILKESGEKFGLINVHVAPRNASAEINSLTDVYTWVGRHWRLRNIILLGDLNADCDYIRKKDFPSIRLLNDPKKYRLLIPNDLDTTVGNTNCAYDRIIVSGPYFAKYLVTDSPGVFKFDTEYNLDTPTALNVSDHYPVEFSLTKSSPSNILQQMRSTSSSSSPPTETFSSFGYLIAVVDLLARLVLNN